ncbi:MAG TPA: dihydrofolate reductase [bacterium]|nr:dihydrofolate reductase [bacterium]HOL48452.1 dihydrofolate reductase [bacterium]HPQ19145.1 dihydrofolate reductase [bacterium]
MQEIIIIVAIANNNVIGKDNTIPWYIKEDLVRFKELTKNHPIIMGKNTYYSLPKRPLPDRINIVLTDDKNFYEPDIIIKYSLEEAIEYCKNSEKIYIIGGASVFQQALKYANKLEITRIYSDIEGNVFFPKINYEEWQLINKIDKFDKNYGNYAFLTYVRKIKRNIF